MELVCLIMHRVTINSECNQSLIIFMCLMHQLMLFNHMLLQEIVIGQNLVGSLANTFVPSVAHPTVTTSVPPNHNRSGVLNPNLQQPYYQKVAYNAQPNHTQLG